MTTREQCSAVLADYMLEVFGEAIEIAARRAVARARSEAVPAAPKVDLQRLQQGLLTVTDAAERLAVSRFWVYRRIESGEIPVVELGDTRKNQRIRESDLDSFIAARTYGV